MTITFLGSSSCRFDAGDDTVHYLIDDAILIDTGWFASAHLRSLGVEPESLLGIIFTHLHHDHYLGFPGVLFSLYSSPKSSRPTVYGPAEDVRHVVTRAEELLQKQRFFPDAATPPVVELPERGSFEIGTTTIHYMPALHPVDARSFLLVSEDGTRIGISGDTAYNAAGARFFEGCDLLVHEASFGSRETPENNPALHSSAMDAARVARDAGAKELVLVHGAMNHREASVQAAASIFNGPISWPEPGQRTTLS